MTISSNVPSTSQLGTIVGQQATIENTLHETTTETVITLRLEFSGGAHVGYDVRSRLAAALAVAQVHPDTTVWNCDITHSVNNVSRYDGSAF